VAVPFARYAHCSRCGNFNLQTIARDRVDAGTLVFLKRFLGFRAFRCDPCRQKFFSVLPYRKIVPSMMPESSRNVPVA
jgi:hypothetical protein